MARARAEMDAMRAKDRARCWERLCDATSAEYPFAREDTAAETNLRATARETRRPSTRAERGR